MSTETLYGLLKLENAKTFKYVQHPKPTQAAPAPSAAGSAAAEGGAGGQGAAAGAGAAGGDGGDAAAMKVYLTKKERKRIRRTTRMERERYGHSAAVVAVTVFRSPADKCRLFHRYSTSTYLKLFVAVVGCWLREC